MDRQGGDGRRRSCCQQKASPDDDDNEPPTHLSAVSLPLHARSFSLCLVAPLLFSSTLCICISASSCDIVHRVPFVKRREDTCALVVTFVGAENTIISLSVFVCVCGFVDSSAPLSVLPTLLAFLCTIRKKKNIDPKPVVTKTKNKQRTKKKKKNASLCFFIKLLNTR